MFLTSIILFLGSTLLSSCADMRPKDPVTGVPFVVVYPGLEHRSLSPITAALRLLAFTTPDLSTAHYIEQPKTGLNYGKSLLNLVRSIQQGNPVHSDSVASLASYAIHSNNVLFKYGKPFDPINTYYEFRQVLDYTLKRFKLDLTSLALKVKESRQCTACKDNADVTTGTRFLLTQTQPDLQAEINAVKTKEVCMTAKCQTDMQFLSTIPMNVEMRRYLEGEPSQLTVRFPADATIRFDVNKELTFNDTRYRLKAVLYEEAHSADKYGVMFFGSTWQGSIQNGTNMTETTFDDEFAPTVTNIRRPLMLIYQINNKNDDVAAPVAVPPPVTPVFSQPVSEFMTTSTLTAKMLIPFQNLPEMNRMEYLRPMLVLLAFIFPNLPNGLQGDHLLSILWSMQKRTGVDYERIGHLHTSLGGNAETPTYADNPEVLLRALFQLLPNQYVDSQSCQFMKQDIKTCTLCEHVISSKPYQTLIYPVQVPKADEKVALMECLKATAGSTKNDNCIESHCPNCNSITSQSVYEKVTEHPSRLLFVSLQRHEADHNTPQYVRVDVPLVNLETTFGRFSELIAFVEQVDQCEFATWVKLGMSRWVRVTKGVMKLIDPAKELNGEPQHGGPRILVYRN